MVYLQTKPGPCGEYAVLALCDRLGVPGVDEAYMLATKDLSILNIVKGLIKDGKIKGYRVARTPALVDACLARGHYLATGTGKHNFQQINKPPHISDFSGKSGHNFAIVENLGDMWKIQDSQGPNRYDGGYWYLPKKYFSQIKTPIFLVK